MLEEPIELHENLEQARTPARDAHATTIGCDDLDPAGGVTARIRGPPLDKQGVPWAPLSSPGCGKQPETATADKSRPSPHG